MCTPDRFHSKILVLMKQTPQIKPRSRTLRIAYFTYRVLIKNKINQTMVQTTRQSTVKLKKIISQQENGV